MQDSNLVIKLQVFYDDHESNNPGLLAKRLKAAGHLFKQNINCVVRELRTVLLRNRHGIDTFVSCLLMIDGSITLITSPTIFIASGTASYVLEYKLSSEYVRHHHTCMNAIFVMSRILLKTIICESRTSLLCNVGKPVKSQLE